MAVKHTRPEQPSTEALPPIDGQPPKEPAPPAEPAPAPKTGRHLSAELGDQFTLTHRDGGEFLLRVTKTGNKRIELELDPRDCIKRITKEI